ncbi:peroxidase family protein [Yoonia sp. R2-816]|uniref:peroxidase family protein n=1 Tax=Yoonia sp. R2-816 TaxID=3342638 RepID=UPI003729C838
MLVSFNHGTDVPVTDGQMAKDGRSFGYYFKTAEALSDDPKVAQAFDNLQQKMVETAMSDEGDHSSQPPIFTYFGQFVDHDVTALTHNRDVDRLPDISDPALAPVPRDTVATSLMNVRTGRLDLDSLYGVSNTVDPQTPNAALNKLIGLMRFHKDRAKMWVGTYGNLDDRVEFPRDIGGDLLRMGRLLDGGFFTLDDIDALPPEHRDLFVKKGANVDDEGAINRNRAVIGDARNDENLFIAQLHLAFLRLHNTLVDAYPHTRKSGDEDDVFIWARTELRKIYQWLILNAWLPQICDPRVVSRIREDGPLLYKRFLVDNNWTKGAPLPLPLEFSTACYRFGHSTVRSTYDWNENFGRGGDSDNRARFQELFAFTGSSPNPMFGQERLPGNWGADMQRLVFSPALFMDRSTRTMDTALAQPLTNMVNQGANAIDRNLVLRNLRRGWQHNLATAQGAAAALNTIGLFVAPLSADDIAAGPMEAEIKAAGFDTSTPLWFYTLKEAQLVGRGQRLGPLASHIVAGTLIGLIEHGPASVLQEPGSQSGLWHPVDGARPAGQVVDSFPAMMRAALLMENPDAD